MRLTVEVPLSEIAKRLDPDDSKMAEWFAYLHRRRKDSESLLDCSARILLVNAILSAKDYAKTADVLKISANSKQLKRVKIHRLLKKYAPHFTKSRRR